MIGKNGYRFQRIQNNYNVKIYTKFQSRSIQGIKEQEMKTCYYGRHCKFLHYSLHPKVSNNQQTTHNEPNQEKTPFTKQQPQQKNLIPNKKQTQTNNQQLELKERLT